MSKSKKVLKAASKASNAVFAIATPSHFAHACSLMESLQEHQPEARRILLMVGADKPFKAPKGLSFEIIDFADWAKSDPSLLNLAFRSTSLQLCCALKPYAAMRLCREFGFEKLIYLDVDIRVFSPLSFMFTELNRHPILLTPHLVDPSFNMNDDGLRPHEGTVISTGIFNMGFFAVDNSPKALEFLEWWKKRTFFRCDHDFANGIFLDQMWTSYVPGLFPEAHILRHPGCNVGFWNLHERPIRSQDGSFYVGDQRLVFFHFSGWSIERPLALSAHQNRFSLESEDLQLLFGEYGVALLDFGAKKIGSHESCYERFDNGLKIEPLIRNLYRRAERQDTSNFGDPFRTEGEKTFFRWLVDPSSEFVSPLALALRNIREDVISAMPYPAGRTGNMRIQEWASDHGFIEMKWPDEWVRIAKAATAKAKGTLVVEADVRRDYVRGPARPSIGYGVNLIGDASVQKSAESLKSAGIPYRICAVETARSKSSRRTFGTGEWGADFSINLVHIDPLDLDRMMMQSSLWFLKSRINIAYWTWDAPEFPKRLHKLFTLFDEIWVPSNFVRDSLSADSPIPVLTVPLPLAASEKSGRPTIRIESSKVTRNSMRKSVATTVDMPTVEILSSEKSGQLYARRLSALRAASPRNV